MTWTSKLAAARIAWLSSVRPDGSPRPVPVWFGHDESGFWVASSPTSRKIDNMTPNDQIAVAIDGSAATPLGRPGAG